jgi:hypothetical protein
MALPITMLGGFATVGAGPRRSSEAAKEVAGAEAQTTAIIVTL